MPRSYQDYIETPDAALGGLGDRLWSSFGRYPAFGSASAMGGFLTEVDEPERFTPPSAFLSPLVLPAAAAALPDIAAPWLGEIPDKAAVEVIDPEYEPLETVFESAPGGIYETNRAPTDWDAVYDEYVILNPPVLTVPPVFSPPSVLIEPAEAIPELEEDVPFHGSIDWGEIAGTVVGGLLDPFGAGAATTAFFQPTQIVAGMGTVPDLGTPTPAITGGVTPMAANGCPPTGPKYAKICLATGAITPLRRRRRRRLLTSSDIKDLSALKSIVGGAALQGAVVQAVRR